MTTDYTHPDYDKFKPLWDKVRDACAGEDKVKAKGKTYLPDPDEMGEDAPRRYEAYKRRATYLNATGRTLEGLIGVAYANWPQIECKYPILLEDADGSGVGLIGQSQAVLSDVLQTARAGLLADWTRGDGIRRSRTVAELERLGRRPFVAAYKAEQILTWERQGTALTRVVLAEKEESHEDGKVVFYPRLRELLLTAKGYTIQVWVKYTSAQYTLKDTIEVGLPYIPFTFVGAVSNDANPCKPPLLDLANLNFAHYRNSADYEESAFLMGQPQLVISGVTDEWKEQTGPVTFGSRKALVLPVGGSADLLQAQANTLAKEAMVDKERLMAMLGARLVAPGEAAKTATQSASETKAAYSVLSLACDNVSEAYTRVLRWLETWGTNGQSKASFAIDTRFNDLSLDANAIRETVAAWQAGIIPQSDAWAVLRRLGVIDQGKTDEQLAGEIEAQGPGLNLDEVA